MAIILMNEEVPLILLKIVWKDWVGNPLLEYQSVDPLYEQLMYTKLFSLKQGTKSIEEYIEEFQELSIWNQVRESDA